MVMISQEPKTNTICVLKSEIYEFFMFWTNQFQKLAKPDTEISGQLLYGS